MSQSSRIAPIEGECVVCGARDARVLSTTRLARGDVVVVCGSHEVSHGRAGRVAASVAELRVLVGDRRARKDRRAQPGDELGLALSAAFDPREHRKRERRS